MNNGNEKLINKIVHLMETDRSIDAPQDAIKWAKNIYRARAVEPKRSLAQKIMAVLQVDLSPGKAAFGERSGPASQARQMLFSAGENSIDLRIAKTEKGFNVRGQILGEGFANSIVKLGKFETVSSELSEFSFNEVQSGKYDLTLQAGETEVVIENLEIE
jgi:hypothetical protein